MVALSIVEGPLIKNVHELNDVEKAISILQEEDNNKKDTGTIYIIIKRF